MGKTIRFNENGLIAIKGKLNEIMVGTDGVSHNDVYGNVKLYHGTDILALVKILKTNRVCASEGRQHGETHGMNWFSLENDGSFNRGACFSIEVPKVELDTVFHKMNNVHVVSKDSCLDISGYNPKVEYFCGHTREGLNNCYKILIGKGERYPVEWIRDEIFYNWCEMSGNEYTYMSVGDEDFGLIMANMLGEEVVRKEGFLSEEVAKEFAPVASVGMEKGGGPGLYAHIGNENPVEENMEKEVESSEVDLSSFKKRDTLPPGIWKDEETLNSKVRLKLLDIADDFWKFVNLTWVEPKEIIITGSICNFNWSKFSDIDLHLVVDFNEIDSKTEFVKQYLDSKKNEWNAEHEGLKIMGFPVELYTQDVSDNVEAGGIYDLEENAWIRRPNPHTIKSIGLEKFDIKRKAAEIMTIIDEMYKALSSTDDGYEVSKIGEDASYLWEKVKSLRKKSLTKRGENGAGNIVYKVLRRKFYLDKLWRLKVMCYDKLNSIEESKFDNKEIIKEYLEKDYNLPLYKYFKWASTASSCEKARDLAYYCSYYIGEYIKEIYYRYSEFENLLNDGEFDYENEEKVETFCKMLEENNLCGHFISIMQDIVDYYELPSWCTMDFNRIVKNEWCIHFGSDSESIAKEGFTGGTPDIESLAYTNAGQQKHYAGYNFAFLINDRKVDYNEYGDEAVIFRTSGVEIYHYGDNQNQVIFWGPNVKSFIPIHQDNGDWVVYGQNGQVLVRCGRPSEIALWATENLPQYRKQIMTGKNGYIPMTGHWDNDTRKYVKEPYPIYRNESKKNYFNDITESTKKYLKVLKEEFAMDGSSEGNPYEKRWKAERDALKNFVANYGKLMQSKEDNKMGRLYKVYYDETMSNLIGYNYCICVQWDEMTMKPKSTVYIRALDKFTPFIRRNLQFDNRGMDNQRGTADDIRQ